MVVEIKVPSAGESVSEAVIATIIKESGSYVEKDEEILELETDKVNHVVHAPEAGVLTLHVKVDETVAIDQVIGTIDPAAKATSAPAAPSAKKKEEPVSPAPASPPYG